MRLSLESLPDLYLFLGSVVFLSFSGVMMPGPVFAVAVAGGIEIGMLEPWSL